MKPDTVNHMMSNPQYAEASTEYYPNMRGSEGLNPLKLKGSEGLLLKNPNVNNIEPSPGFETDYDNRQGYTLQNRSW
jgi:hypothetical protein